MEKSYETIFEPALAALWEGKPLAQPHACLTRLAMRLAMAGRFPRRQTLQFLARTVEGGLPAATAPLAELVVAHQRLHGFIRAVSALLSPVDSTVRFCGHSIRKFDAVIRFRVRRRLRKGTSEAAAHLLASIVSNDGAQLPQSEIPAFLAAMGFYDLKRRVLRKIRLPLIMREHACLEQILARHEKAGTEMLCTFFLEAEATLAGHGEALPHRFYRYVVRRAWRKFLTESLKDALHVHPERLFCKCNSALWKSHTTTVIEVFKQAEATALLAELYSAYLAADVSIMNDLQQRFSYAERLNTLNEPFLTEVTANHYAQRFSRQESAAQYAEWLGCQITAQKMPEEHTAVANEFTKRTRTNTCADEQRSHEADIPHPFEVAAHIFAALKDYSVLHSALQAALARRLLRSVDTRTIEHERAFLKYLQPLHAEKMLRMVADAEQAHGTGVFLMRMCKWPVFKAVPVKPEETASGALQALHSHLSAIKARVEEELAANKKRVVWFDDLSRAKIRVGGRTYELTLRQLQFLLGAPVNNYLPAEDKMLLERHGLKPNAASTLKICEMMGDHSDEDVVQCIPAAFPTTAQKLLDDCTGEPRETRQVVMADIMRAMKRTKQSRRAEIPQAVGRSPEECTEAIAELLRKGYLEEHGEELSYVP